MKVWVLDFVEQREYLIEHYLNEWHSGSCWALWDC
jgi:hypothetical protein